MTFVTFWKHFVSHLHIVTQLLHQLLHIYKIYKNLHIKTLETLRHVSVLGPSSVSYIVLAKVTL